MNITPIGELKKQTHLKFVLGLLFINRSIYRSVNEASLPEPVLTVFSFHRGKGSRNKPLKRLVASGGQHARLKQSVNERMMPSGEYEESETNKRHNHLIHNLLKWKFLYIKLGLRQLFPRGADRIKPGFAH